MGSSRRITGDAPGRGRRGGRVLWAVRRPPARCSPRVVLPRTRRGVGGRAPGATPPPRGGGGNAHLPSARSTRNLRVRGGSGRPGGARGWARPPGTGLGDGVLRRNPASDRHSRRPGEVGGVVRSGAGPAARPATAPPGRSAAADCPNLPQRPRSSRSAREETLIFRAFLRGRSRPGESLWQIWTRPRPESPQEPHQHHADTPRITFPDTPRITFVDLVRDRG